MSLVSRMNQTRTEETRMTHTTGFCPACAKDSVDMTDVEFERHAAEMALEKSAEFDRLLAAAATVVGPVGIDQASADDGSGGDAINEGMDEDPTNIF